MKKKPIALALFLCLLVTAFSACAEEGTNHSLPGITLVSNGGSILMDGGEEEDSPVTHCSASLEPGQAFGEALEMDRIIALSKDGVVFAGWTLYDVSEMAISDACVEQEGLLCFGLRDGQHMVLRTYTAHDDLFSTKELAECVCGEHTHVAVATWMTAGEYLARTMEKADAVRTCLEQEAMTQLDMNQKSEELRTLWDEAMTLFLAEAEKLLPEEDAARLRAGQSAWEAEMEAAVEASGKEFEGGSLYPLIVNTEAARLTEERVYKLYELLN